MSLILNLSGGKLQHDKILYLLPPGSFKIYNMTEAWTTLRHYWCNLFQD